MLFLILGLVFIPVSIFAKEIPFVDLKKKPKTHLPIISALDEGDIVMFGRRTQGFERATKFVGHFCDHEKEITFVQMNYATGSVPFGTCVFKRNGSDESYIK